MRNQKWSRFERRVRTMQADNLRPEDMKKFESLFKEIREDNPIAEMHVFKRNKFERKDCLFKEKCKK